MISNLFNYLEPSKIPYEDIARRLGYPDSSKIEDKEKKIIESLIEELKKNWEPKAVIKTVKIEDIKEDKIICKEIDIPGKEAVKILKNSKLISFVAATLGKKSAELLKNKREKLSEYFFLDGIESEIIEQIIEDINKMIEKYANVNGYKTTKRISPGYLDIPLSFQKKLINFLDKDGSIGIKVNEKYIMEPEKSITCIIGLEKNKSIIL